MTLKTMSPNPVWDAPSYEDAVDTLAAHATDITVRVWGGDWCKDCRAILPDFAAALDAAGLPDDRIVTYALDQDKEGPGVDEFNIEFIPTIVVERNGNEIARFVESESQPPAVYLAERLDTQETTA